MSRVSIVTPLMAAFIAAVPIAAQTIPTACRPLVDAERKQVVTPARSFATHSAAGASAPVEESISTGDALYIRDGARWKKIPVTKQEMLDRLDATLKETTRFACHQLADETLGGVATSVYQAHTESDGTKSDGKMWIAKSSGLIVRQDSDLDSGDGDKMHISMRYEYTDVHAPSGVP